MELNRSIWTSKDYEDFISYLYSKQDIKYREFHKGIVPNIDSLIGIRTPILKDIAKKISKGNYNSFISLNKHNTYEEIFIHGIIIGNIKLSFNDKLILTDKFIPYINNWAICDSFCSNFKDFKKNQKQGFAKIKLYLKSDNLWINRVGLVLLLNHYINDNYIDQVLDITKQIKSNEYYVKMANAWLISMCYIKYPKKTYKLLESKKLDKWTQNKSISKIRDSFRVTDLDKKKITYLKK